MGPGEYQTDALKEGSRIEGSGFEEIKRRALAEIRKGPSLFTGHWPLYPGPFFYCACWMAESFQAFFPTGRVKVQYSSNFTGSVRLPDRTCFVDSSIV